MNRGNYLFFLWETFQKHQHPGFLGLGLTESESDLKKGTNVKIKWHIFDCTMSHIRSQFNCQAINIKDQSGDTMGSGAAFYFIISKKQSNAL